MCEIGKIVEVDMREVPSWWFEEVRVPRKVKVIEKESEKVKVPEKVE